MLSPFFFSIDTLFNVLKYTVRSRCGRTCAVRFRSNMCYYYQNKFSIDLKSVALVILDYKKTCPPPFFTPATVPGTVTVPVYLDYLGTLHHV